MSNCKHCNKPIKSNTGRRPRLYCNDTCKNAYFNAQNKGKQTTKVLRATYEAVVKERDHYKALVLGLNPVTERNAGGLTVKKTGNEKLDSALSTDPEMKAATATFDLAAMDKRYDEIKRNCIMTPTVQDQIDKLKGEYALVTGKSSVASDMKRSIQKKIDRLEKELYKTN